MKLAAATCVLLLTTVTSLMTSNNDALGFADLVTSTGKLVGLVFCSWLLYCVETECRLS